MTELYQTVYKSRPPVIDGLLYSGAYILAGAPKIGKSFLVAQLPTMSAQGEGCGAMKSIRVRFCTLHWRMISRESRVGCL